MNEISETESLTHLERKKGQIILFFSVAFRRHFVLLVPVPLGSCYKLVVVVASHDALCFTDMDDLEEGKISTIFLNEFASLQENHSFSRIEYMFAYFCFILLQLFVTKQRS